MSDNDMSDCVNEGSISQKAQHFTPIERNLLLQLIEDNKIVESKKTGPKIIVEKQKAWSKIQDEFNSFPETTFRSAKQLKRCWENCKLRAKAEVAAVKRKKKSTGGGPPASELTAQTSLICSMIPSQMTSLHNNFDSDAPEESLSLNNVLPNGTLHETTIANETATNNEENHRIASPPPHIKRALKNYKARKHAVEKRSFVIQMEEEEHKLNMAMLHRKLEYEDLQLKKLKRSYDLMEIESEKRITLLNLQISAMPNSSVVSGIFDS